MSEKNLGLRVIVKEINLTHKPYPLHINCTPWILNDQPQIYFLCPYKFSDTISLNNFTLFDEN